MNKTFNIVGYEMRTGLFECHCVVCEGKYFISMNLLPQDLGLCNTCEREVFILEDLLRKSPA